MSDQTAPFFASGKHPFRSLGRTVDRTQTYTFVHGCLKILAQIDFSISNNTSASSVCKDREGGWFFLSSSLIKTTNRMFFLWEENVSSYSGPWGRKLCMAGLVLYSKYTMISNKDKQRLALNFLPSNSLVNVQLVRKKMQDPKPWESVGFVLWSWLIFTLVLLFCFLSNDLLLITSQLVGCTTEVVFTGKKKRE